MSSSSSSEEVVSVSAAVNEETPVSLPRSNPPPLDRDNPDQDEQQQQQDDDDDDEYLVSCQCESARLLSTLLRCLVMDKGRHGANLTLTHSMTHTSASMNTSTATGISTNNNNNHKKLLLPVTVVCHPTSLTFHVQGAARTSHASVDLPAGLFLDYRVRALSSCPTTCTTQQQQQLQEPPCFSVNLTTLLDCLHVLGTHHLDRCKVGLAYNASQQVLHMELLMDDGLLSKSAIPGLDLVDPYHHTMGHTTTAAASMDAAASRNATTCTRHHTPTPTTTTTTTYLATAFGSTPIAARLLVRSDLLREALHELESYQVHDPATSCTVAMSQKHGLELAVVGHACEVVLSLLPPQLPPCESQSQHGSPLCLLSLECPVPQAWTYPLYALWLGMRALETAHETCMSINQEGMIAIQHQVMAPDDVGDGTSPSFVDFLLMPLLQEDDDETDANEKVVASSLDTSNLNSPSAMSMSMRRNRASQNSHAIGDDDNGDPFKSDSNDSMEEEEEEMERPLSAAPLFGTVVPSGKNGGGAGAGRGGTTMDRAVRPRRRRRPAPTEVDMDDENETGEEYDSDDEPLNVTEATRRPLGRLSDDPPSSPELVYGDDC